MKHGKYGHVSICTGEGTTHSFYSYDQNWGGKGQGMKKTKHDYKGGFEGVLRPRNQIRINPNITYQVHVQNQGWQEPKENWEIAGTEGQGLRIEAIKIHADCNIKYRVHIQDLGWSEWVPNDVVAGTTGQSKRIEAIEIVTDGTCEIKATAHIQDIGWQETIQGKIIKIGTEGRALRLEALKLEIV